MKQKLFSQFIFLNGNFYKIQAYKIFNLKNLIFYLCYKENLIVLEYNQKICCSKDWDLIKLNFNDKVETITIVGGG